MICVALFLLFVITVFFGHKFMIADDINKPRIVIYAIISLTAYSSAIKIISNLVFGS